MSLSALIRKREASSAATAIPAISAIQKTGTTATVARIATIAVATTRVGTTSPVWLIHRPDRQPAEVHCWPPATRAEILAIYPTAINAEPMQAPHSAEPEPDKAQPHQEEKAPPAPDAGRWRAGPAALPPRSCRTCRHLRRPGLSDGHCGERDDLPPAYTAGHPLRRLPDDRGAGCTTWEESR